MASILYSVGWNSGSRKFTVRETRSFGWRTNIVDLETHDTFRAAYDAAKTLHDALAEAQGDIVKMAPEAACCKTLRRSWGMSKTQKEEIASYLKDAKQHASATGKQGREEALNASGSSEGFTFDNPVPAFAEDFYDLSFGNDIFPDLFGLVVDDALTTDTYLSFDRPPMPAPGSYLRPSLADRIQAANERQARKAGEPLEKGQMKSNFPER